MQTRLISRFVHKAHSSSLASSGVGGVNERYDLKINHLFQPFLLKISQCYVFHLM